MAFSFVFNNYFSKKIFLEGKLTLKIDNAASTGRQRKLTHFLGLRLRQHSRFQHSGPYLHGASEPLLSERNNSASIIHKYNF